MTTLVGTRLSTLDDDALADAVTTIAPPVLDALSGADRVVVVPDAHYPYHPSTGMVTNPALVDALLSRFAERLPRADLAVAVRSGRDIETRRVLGYLDYDSVTTNHDAALTVLDDRDTRGSSDAADEQVPEELQTGAVVTVPSARIAGRVPIYGSLALLATAAGVDPADPTAVARAVHAVDPAGAVLDATYTFTGEPRRGRALLAGDDVGAVEATQAALVDVERRTVPGLASVSPWASGDPPRVDGLDVTALAESLPDGSLPESKTPHSLVRAGYRLYTRVSGDVYPPQLEGDT
jgi:hypothetical protein